MKLLIKLLIFTVLLASPALAKTYFSANSISPKLIDPPISTSSKQWQDEVEYIVKLQKSADPDEVEQALEERVLKVDMVAQFVDARLSRQDFPKLYELLDNSKKTTYKIVRKAKNFWGTKRPFVAVSDKIKPLIKAHDNPAYPSGHTSGSYVAAHVLSMLLPQKRTEIMERAEEIAQHRVLVGMHYPHDLVGGKQMALIILGALMQNDDFLEDLKEAKYELSQKL